VDRWCCAAAHASRRRRTFEPAIGIFPAGDALAVFRHSTREIVTAAELPHPTDRMAITTLPLAEARISERVAAAVRDGLALSPKRLPPWLFYDEAGSRLFEQITELLSTT